MDQIFSFDFDLFSFFIFPIIFMVFLAAYLFWPEGGDPSKSNRNN